MVIPKLGNGKFIIIRADNKTGNILNNDGSVFIGQNKDFFIVKDNIEQATEYAKNTLNQRNDIEIMIYDDNASFIEIFRPPLRKE